MYALCGPDLNACMNFGVVYIQLSGKVLAVHVDRAFVVAKSSIGLHASCICIQGNPPAMLYITQNLATQHHSIIQLYVRWRMYD